jgi:indole-3-glycerol phosphate synthase
MNDNYIKTNTILDRILAHKAKLIQEIYDQPDQFALLERAADLAQLDYTPRDFIGALRQNALEQGTVAVIAEVKKASPSKGVLIEDFDPVALATTYAQNGASAISVLTDEEFFQGSLDYLRDVRMAVDCPLLMKDFIIDPCQIYMGRAAGADAMLLIVAALSDNLLVELHGLITSLGMAALVEVHNQTEMERALKLGARLIGVNNRNLKTFRVDLETTANVARYVPKGVMLVAESGMKTSADVQRMGRLGAHAALIGEGLVTAENIATTVREFSSQKREVGG